MTDNTVPAPKSKKDLHTEKLMRQLESVQNERKRFTYSGTKNVLLLTLAQNPPTRADRLAADLGPTDYVVPDYLPRGLLTNLYGVLAMYWAMCLAMGRYGDVKLVWFLGGEDPECAVTDRFRVIYNHLASPRNASLDSEFFGCLNSLRPTKNCLTLKAMRRPYQRSWRPCSRVKRLTS